ncbi:MAG: GNAT family N-acetyltransferase [Candidatus Dormibacteria bacterium]
MSQLTTARVAPSEMTRLGALLDTDPVQNVYLRSELRLTGAAAPWFAVSDGRGLRSAVLAGALTVPWIPHTEDARPLALAMRAAAPVHLMVGPSQAVHALHGNLDPQRRAHQLRDHQPVMVVDRPRLQILAPAPLRPATARDVDRLARAAADMHAEEMHGDTRPPDAAAWLARMRQLVDRSWSWCWVERGELLFKAELSAWTPEVAQVQGVFTTPANRGRGIATAAMAALCSLLLQTVPLVTLYVNSHNHSALRLYRRLGFEQVGEFATVMY